MTEGRVHPEFERVGALFDRLVGRRGGGALAVYVDGEPVVDVWGGTRDRRGNPWTRDTVAMSFSTTKGVVATAAHRLVERDILDLDAPVADYWPEFASHAKQGIRVHHLLSHSAGMHRIRGVVASAETITDWDAMVRALAAAPPAWAPGQVHGYHGLTYGWLVGELLRRATGLPTVRAVVQREVADPLGIEELAIGAPQRTDAPVAELFGAMRGSEPAYRLADRLQQRERLREPIAAFVLPGLDRIMTETALADAEVPAVNGMFTARDLARMYAAVGGDDRFLSPRTRRNATTVQTDGRDVIVGVRMRWRLGYHLTATSRGPLPRGFGHFGFGGSGAWYDPDHRLALGFVTNRIGGVVTPFADSRIVRLGGAALASMRPTAAVAGPRTRGAGRGAQGDMYSPPLTSRS